MLVPRLTLTFFGPFEARYNHQILNFATDKIRALFVYLALEPGKPHRRETLAALLWPDYPDETALRNVRQSVYRLRQTLQHANPALPDLLLTQTRLTIALHENTLETDVARFTNLLQDAKTAPDPIPLLTQATQLYSGELLQGFSLADAYAFDEWLSIQREIFHQQMLDALTRLLTLQEHDPDAVLATAPRLLALAPWHEETHRQIMRAHLQKGNRPQALAHYYDLRANLQRDLGVEPASTTTAIINETPAEPTPISIPTPSTPAQPTLHHFPTPLTPLIGRKSEIHAIIDTITQTNCRLLTITGSGGMGKTRLAIETARRLSSSKQFTDGMYFVPLAQLDQGKWLASTITQQLGMSLSSSANPQTELLKHLHPKRLLLLLDNFEHLLPEAASLIGHILTTASNTTLLITSRDPLALQGEWVFPLEGLPFSLSAETENPLELPAAQLFIQSARRYRPSFDPTTQGEWILSICRLTDGLPLALEMAAAWMRAYNCQEIAERLSQSLDFLTNPYRDAPPRQRSIRAIFTSTWEQLNAEHRKVLAALSIFRGGFTISAALTVAQASILDLATLVEKSLLRRADRYDLHELVRQFAAEMLIEIGDESDVQTRHARYYLDYLSQQTPGLNGPFPQNSLEAIRQEGENIRHAWDWAVSVRDVALITNGLDGLVQWWMLSGASLEGEGIIEKTISAFQSLTDPTHTLLSLLESSLAWLRVGLGKNQQALQNVKKALTLAGAYPISRATALSVYGWALQTQGQYDEAEAALEEAVALFEQTGHPFQQSLALIRLGGVHWRKRNFEKTLKYYQRSLQIEQIHQNKRGINRAYGGIGLVYLNLEKYPEALEWLARALQLDRELSNQPGIARQLGNMGAAYLNLGHFDRALACFQEAVEIDRRTGNKITLAIWLENLGTVYTHTHQPELALQNFDESIQLFRDAESRFNLPEPLLGKAELLLAQGADYKAKALIEEALQLSDDLSRQDTQTRGKMLRARLLARTDPPAARVELEDMLTSLADLPAEETRAHIYYSLWHTDHHPEDARRAKELYQTCLARSPKFEYKSRLDELHQIV